MANRYWVGGSGNWTYGKIMDSNPNYESNVYALRAGSYVAVGQSFTGNGKPIKFAAFRIKKNGAPTGNMTYKLYSHTGTYGTSGNAGTLLATSNAYSVQNVSTVAGNVTLGFPTPYTSVNGTKYFVVVEYSGGDASNSLYVYQDPDDTHAGNMTTKVDGGSFQGGFGGDLCFEVWDGSGWSATSGGPDGENAPADTDNVYFDANSFSAPGQIVTIGNGSRQNLYINIGMFDTFGVTENPVFELNGNNAYTSRISVYNDFTITNQNISFSYLSGNWDMRLGSAVTTTTINFDTSGVELPFLWSIIGPTTVNLLSDLVISSSGGYAVSNIASDSVLNTNGYMIDAPDMYSLTGTLNLGSSEIHTGSFKMGSGGVVNRGTSTIYIDNPNLSGVFDGLGKTFYNLVIKQDTNVRSSNTFHDVVIDGAVDVTFNHAFTTTIENDLSVINTSPAVVPIESYVADTTTFSMHTLTGSATTLSLGDDAFSSLISLPFSFEFFGNTKTGIYVSSNGFLSFSGDYDFPDEEMPNSGTPNDAIFGVGYDLNPTSGGTIKYETFGSSPNRVFVVEFNGVPEYGETAPNTFQIKLFETDNSVEVHVLESSGIGYSVRGLENSDGTIAVYKASDNPIQNALSNDAVRYSPSTVDSYVGYAGLYSSTSGNTFYLSKSSGQVLVDNVKIKDSVATGGASFIAQNSIDEGNNSGWVFGSVETVDGSVSSEYSVQVVETISKSSEYAIFEEFDIQKIAQYGLASINTINLDGGYEVQGSTVQKRYFAKVYSPQGAFKASWHNILVKDFELSKEINTNGSAITLELSRDADDYGEGDDINYRNKVEVYVVDKEVPNGLLYYTGFISYYKPDYATESVEVSLFSYGRDMTRIVLEDGSGNTKIDYFSLDPSAIMKDILDKFVAAGGNVSYDVSSIDDTNTTVSYSFNTVTIKEAIDKILQLAPVGWYYYIDQATNTFHFHEKGTLPDHSFAIGRDLKLLSIRKSVEPVVNVLYFSGGEVSEGVNLYKKYTLPSSITNYGIQADRYKDGRVTLESTADVIAQKVLRGDPEILVEVEIIDSNNNELGYDLESIHEGQMVKIGSSGIGASSVYDSAVFDTSPYDYDLTNLSSIIFQITGLSYTGDSMKFTLSTTPPDITKRIQDISRNLTDIQNSSNPDAPTV